MSALLPSAEDLARFTLAVQHPATRRWVDDAVRSRRLATAHESDLRLATDRDLAAQRAEMMHVGQQADAFLNRWLTVSDDLEAMLSIRFEGLDREKPFVDATVLSRPFAGDDLSAMARVATETYELFLPGYLRVWSAEPTDAFPGTDRDRRFLGAPLRDLVGREVPIELSVAPTRDLCRYPDALAAYAAVDAVHPGHPGQATIQDADDLQESIETGTLFDVLVHGEWAGYVGATSDGGSDLGLAAHVVQEIILVPEQRGRGYGAHLTTLLAAGLPGPDNVLLGAIHADNRGALAGAMRAGRQDIGGWLQLPLDETP